jgi:mRNA interferase HigB
MTVIGLNVLHDFGQKHADVKSQIDTWVAFVGDAQWTKPLDLKQSFPKASICPDNRVIFDLKGNRYRLEVKISYATKIVLVKRMGTHAEYSKWKL